MRVGHACLVRWQLPRHKWVFFQETLNEADRLVAVLPTHTVEARYPHRGGDHTGAPRDAVHAVLLRGHERLQLRTEEPAADSHPAQDDHRDRRHDPEGALRYVPHLRAGQHGDLHWAQDHHHLPLRTARRWRHHPAGRLHLQHLRGRVRRQLRQLLHSATAAVQDHLPNDHDLPLRRLRPELPLRRRWARELTHLFSSTRCLNSTALGTPRAVFLKQKATNQSCSKIFRT